MASKSARQKCLQAFQKLRRLQCADDNGYITCISSGRRYQWNNGVDGGHFIQRGCPATELEPDNVWPQSKHDNRHLSGNHASFRSRLIRKIGPDRVERLEDMAAAYHGDGKAFNRLNDHDKRKVYFTPTNHEYDQLAKEFRAKARAIEKHLPEVWA